MSAQDDPAKAKIEQAGLDIKYQAQFQRFLEREDNLRQALVKAYALIFSNYCSSDGSRTASRQRLLPR